jgi:predicted ATPase
LVEGLAARQPVLLLFEDAHWSDTTSLELYDLIIDRVPRLPGFLIVTFRPEFTPAWTGRPQVTSLGLNRLAPRQRAEMIAGITGGKRCPGRSPSRSSTAPTGCRSLSRRWRSWSAPS